MSGTAMPIGTHATNFGIGAAVTKMAAAAEIAALATAM